jgi:hypothetical protein
MAGIDTCRGPPALESSVFFAFVLHEFAARAYESVGFITMARPVEGEAALETQGGFAGLQDGFGTK